MPHVPKRLAMAAMPLLVVRPKPTKPRSVLARTMIRARSATGRLGPLPDFLIVGAQRAGTTSLYHRLLGHPDVYPALAKEVHFFDRHFGLGTDWYRANFSPHLGSGGHVTGEATPDYLAHPHAMRRVAEVAPDTKVIVLLRDPVTRALSHHRLMVQLGHETLPFAEALDAEAERTGPGLAAMLADETVHSRDWNLFSYVQRGHYPEQLRRLYRHIDAEQVLVLPADALRTTSGFATVCTFLGLGQPDADDAAGGAAPGPGAPDASPRGAVITEADKEHLDPAIRARLEAEFAPDRAELTELLGAPPGW